jgi:hypothetical protein
VGGAGGFFDSKMKFDGRAEKQLKLNGIPRKQRQNRRKGN